MAELSTGPPGIAAALVAPFGSVQPAMLAGAGFALLSAMPVQLATMHELLPDNRGMATGIVYFTAMQGSIASLLVLGALADVVRLTAAILGGLSISITGMVGILLLPCATAPIRQAAQPPGEF